MTLGNISGWLWRGRDLKVGPRLLLSSVSSSALTAIPHTSSLRSNAQCKPSLSEEVVMSGRSSGSVGNHETNRSTRSSGGVLVSVDWICTSDSGLDNYSDWSIGWFEPQSSEFSTETESEKSFAFLVPCYSLPTLPEEELENGECRRKMQLNDALLSNSPTIDSQKYVQQWLDSLKNE